MAPTPTETARGAQWDDLSTRQRRVLLVSVLARTVLATAGLLVVYAVAPIGQEATVTTMGIMVIGSIVVVAMLAIELRAVSRSPHPVLRVVETISNLLVVFILFFALIYLSLSETNPASFTEPITKVSAVYFTVTVLATVGFGDITPVTDATRIMVTIQMVLGLTLIAVLVRFMITYAQRLQSQRQSSAGITGVAGAAGVAGVAAASASSGTADIPGSADGGPPDGPPVS